MAHRNSAPIGDLPAYTAMLQDAARFRLAPLAGPPYNLSGITGFTITHFKIDFLRVKSHDDIVLAHPAPLPPYLPKFLLKHIPIRIILKWNTAPEGVSWHVQKMINQDVNSLSDQYYVLDYNRYHDMRGYVSGTLGESSEGIVAIPCRDALGNFYFYFGIYKLIPVGQNNGTRIKNQNGREIEIFPGGPGGDGDSAGARIPAP